MGKNHHITSNSYDAGHTSHEMRKPDKHHDHNAMMLADFKKRFWVSFIITIPILLLSPLIQEFFSFKKIASFPGDIYVLFALSSIIYFYGGYPFLKGIFDELRSGSPGMMTLIALAITTAYLYSSAVVFGLSGIVFFWELATLIDVMLLGHWIEMKYILGASRALGEVAGVLSSVGREPRAVGA